MKKQQLLDYFKGNREVAEDFMYEGYSSNETDWAPGELKSVTFKVEDHYGGEDQGSNYYSVYSFETEDEGTIYLKFYGWYASHYGCDYEDFCEVKPREKTIVVWE